MLTVTRAARAYLAQLLAQAHAPDDIAFRFVLDGSDFGPMPGNARPDDTIVAHG
jgi:hypothetical protein